MTTQSIRPSSVTLAALAAASLLSTPAAIAAGHCASTEQTLFTCEVGAKTVSVCASADLAAGHGELQYRFGRPGAIELAWPPAQADWRPVTRGGTLAFSGGGGAYLAFARPPYRYVVYTAIGHGWGNRAGVVVVKDGRRIASLACRGQASSVLGPDLFTRSAITLAEDGFELP